MSDKTVRDLLDKSINQDVAKQQKNKIQALQEKVKDIEQNESAHRSAVVRFWKNWKQTFPDGSTAKC